MFHEFRTADGSLSIRANTIAAIAASGHYRTKIYTDCGLTFIIEMRYGDVKNLLKEEEQDNG